MSTNTQQQTQYSFAPSSVQERPKLASTGLITGIGEAKETASGDYVMIDLIFKPTHGSRKIFPRLMIRPEMFSIPYFSPKIYTDYQKFPALAGVKDGKTKTLGETFALVYRQNVAPSISTNKKTGAKYPERTTALMAIAGGTMQGFEALAQVIGEKLAEVVAQGRENGEFGFPELTVDEIVALLKSFHAAQPQGQELALVIKQSTDESGNVKDQYELDAWRGPFTKEQHERFVKASEESRAKNPNDISKQTLIGYRL